MGALDRLRVDLDASAPADLAALFDAPVERFSLEIGFGGGEHLLHRASGAPRTGHLGVEPFVNGMASLLRHWVDDPLPNLRLYDDDAVRLIDWLPDASLDHVDLLYPDPWRKRAHHKRRFVGPANLDRLARVLKPGATFHFASDWAPYVEWTLKHVAAHPLFAEERPDDRAMPYEGWPGTRYEAKAIREGRTPAYLRYRRLDSVAPSA